MAKRVLSHTFTAAARVAVAFALVMLSFLPAPLLERAGLESSVEVAQALPTMTATKDDLLVVDHDNDGVADTGDTIRYTTILTQSGTTNASSVQFADTIDANTTLVPGSVRTTPIARNDGPYSVLGNVGISVPAGSGVLANDHDPDGTTPVLTVASFDASSVQGGNVTVAGDGSFTYVPPPGFEGADSFTYRVQDTDGNQDPASVSVSVSRMVWFIDNRAAPGGDGRLGSPFNSLGSYNSVAADDPGDSIFVYGGSGAYGGGIALQSSQLLIGQGATASIATIAGLAVPPFSYPLPATGGGKPVLENSGGHGITVAANNLVRGLDVGNTAGAGLVGTAVGTLSVQEVAITGTGGGLDINGGTLTVVLQGLTTNSSTEEGLRLVNVNGSVSVPTGSISTNGVPAVDIDGNPSLSLSVTLGSVSASNAANGILVRDTTGSFAVTGSGAIDGSGGTISAIINRGASFVNAANIALSNLTFSNASTAKGAGSCDAASNSGCNAAIHLENSSAVNLTNVDISSSAQQGINGLNVNGFTLANSTVTSCGNQANEGCLRMVNLAGTASIVNSNLSFPAERVAQIDNTNVTLFLTVNGSTFRDTQSSGLGADGLEVTSGGASNTTIDVINSSFLRNRTNGLQVHSTGTSVVSLDVSGSTFDRGGGIGIGMDLAAANSATLNFNVIGNPLINGRGSQAINVFSGDSATVQGRINNNPNIQAGGSTESGFGIGAQADGNSTMRLEIDSNTISNIGWDAGIRVLSRLGTTGRLDARINNNTVTVDPGGNSLYDIWVQAQNSNTVCAYVTNNSTSGNGSAAFRVRTVDSSSTAILQGAGASATAIWDGNGNTPTGSVSSSHNGTLTLGGTCNTVSHPTAGARPSQEVVSEPDSRPQAGAAARMPPSLAERAEPLGEVVTVAGLGTVLDRGREWAAGLAADLVSAFGATPAYASGETVNLALDDVNPGQVVAITFDVTVDAAPASSVQQVCNQGLFSGSNFADVLTDDPDVGGAGDPTCTPVEVDLSFQLTSHSPVANAVDVARGSLVTAGFSTSLNKSSVSADSFLVHGEQTGRYGGSFAFPAADGVEFTPGQPFKPGETVFVTGSSQVQGGGGEVLTPYTWQFTAATAPAGAGMHAHPTAPSFEGGLYTLAVALGDLDGDGDLDAVTANSNGKAQTVWLNDSHGTFTPHPKMPSFGADTSVDLALGDLDGDGDLDAVVANYEDQGTTVWLNDGSGGFTAHPAVPRIGSGWNADVALGDLDGDGDLDAVVANLQSAPETVWLNDGSGAFTAHPTVPSFGAGTSYGLALGDLDGDGDLDAVVTGTFSEAETVWLNDGSGAFAPHPTVPSFGGEYSWDVALGDLDGDGDLDAVVANVLSEAETVWLNDGSGAFTDHPTTPSFGADASAELALGDLDGDGDLDAVVANGGNESETTWLNDGSGTFTAHPVVPSFGLGGSRGVALGDLDGDGDLDAVVANSGEEAETVWLNEGYSTYLPLVISNWP